MTTYRVIAHFTERQAEGGADVAFTIEAEDERALRAWLRLTLPREVDWYDMEEIPEAA